MRENDIKLASCTRNCSKLYNSNYMMTAGNGPTSHSLVIMFSRALEIMYVCNYKSLVKTSSVLVSTLHMCSDISEFVIDAKITLFIKLYVIIHVVFCTLQACIGISPLNSYPLFYIFLLLLTPTCITF